MKDQSTVSPLSRTVKCEGQELYIEIFGNGEGQWLLAVTNEQQVTTHWTDPFKTDSAALKEAMKTIKSEGLEAFTMETPYKYEVH